jgi:hypothetical protein
MYLYRQGWGDLEFETAPDLRILEAPMADWGRGKEWIKMEMWPVIPPSASAPDHLPAIPQRGPLTSDPLIVDTGHPLPIASLRPLLTASDQPVSWPGLSAFGQRHNHFSENPLSLSTTATVVFILRRSRRVEDKTFAILYIHVLSYHLLHFQSQASLYITSVHETRKSGTVKKQKYPEDEGFARGVTCKQDAGMTTPITSFSRESESLTTVQEP